MHVREIPKIIFDEMAPEPETQNVRDYLQDNYPNLASQKRESPDDLRHIGETAGKCWLWLHDSESTTRLSVHPSLERLFMDVPSLGIGSLVAGHRYTGTWAYGLGEKVQETLWINTHHESFAGPEGLAASAKGLVTLGNMAFRALQLLAEGQFDLTTFFEAETHINPDIITPEAW